MIFTKQVAVAAAFSMFGIGFLLAYGATTAASAQAQPFEAPAIVVPAIAGAVEPTPSQAAPLQDADGAGATAQAESLDALVEASVDDATLDAQTRCLATAVFFESRSESLAGQLAVANVVIARAQSGRFPASLCGVITQPGQFGFVRKGRMPDAPTDNPHWRTAKAIARIALDQAWHNPVEGALYFHAAYRGTNWGREEVARIGGHIFYR
jgi:spore germination cell wall hydrolase CwlJ-like protein